MKKAIWIGKPHQASYMMDLTMKAFIPFIVSLFLFVLVFLSNMLFSDVLEMNRHPPLQGLLIFSYGIYSFYFVGKVFYYPKYEIYEDCILIIKRGIVKSIKNKIFIDKIQSYECMLTNSKGKTATIHIDCGELLKYDYDTTEKKIYKLEFIKEYELVMKLLDDLTKNRNSTVHGLCKPIK